MQLGEWNVDVDGRAYVVTVERAENGKDVVRINGRVAAKPISSEEKERTVSIGGAPYAFRRLAVDKYGLDLSEVSAPGKSPSALAREIQEKDGANEIR